MDRSCRSARLGRGQRGEGSAPSVTRLIPSPSVVNRGLVVGVGRYGARALAHLWPRLTFEDYQRRHLRPNLPSLRRLLSVSLILPDRRGGFVAGRPDPADWDDSAFLRQLVRHTARPELGTPEPETGDRENSFIAKSLMKDETRKKCPGDAHDPTRHTYFQTAMEDSDDQLGRHLTQVAHRALIDEDAPGSEMSRFTVYLIAALRDRFGSALLWPTVMTLRQQLTHLPLEVISLLNPGTFGKAEALTEQQASVHAGLRELECFSRGAVDLSGLGLAPEKRASEDRRYFDQCFLLDRQKLNGALARDEDEIIVCTANLVEAMTISDSLDTLVEQLGADYEVLERRGRFAAVGTASVYIPFDDWRRRNVDQFALEMVEAEYLGLSRQRDLEEAETTRHAANQFIESHLQPAKVTERMVRNCPFRQARKARLVEDLLTETGQNTPLLDEESPSQPIPEMVVVPEELRVQLPPWAPDVWLSRVRSHYRGIGLDVSHLLGRGPSSRNLPAEGGDETQPRADLRDWFDAMIAACDTRRSPSLHETRDTTPPGVPRRSPSGVVPEFGRRLREEIGLLLKDSNRGLLAAQALLDRVGVHLRTSIDRVVDYRTRLNRALESEEEVQESEHASQHLLRFQRLIDSRPTAGGLAGRSTMLTALIAVIVYHWATIEQLLRYLPRNSITAWLGQQGDQVWPWASVAAGLLSAAIVAATVFAVNYFQLRRAIRVIERALARQVNLLINQWILRLLYDEEGRGLLANLGLALSAQQSAVDRAIDALRNHARELKEDLATPWNLREPAIRQPLPGLDRVRERLMGDARPNLSDLPSTLLAADPGDEVHLLDPILAHDIEIAEARAGLSDDTEAEIADRYPEVPEKYQSLGDLLFTAVRRIAEQAGEITPPADLQIANLLSDKVPGYTPRTFLADLSRRAQPTLNWDPEELEESMPVPVDLIVMAQGPDSPTLIEAARERRLSAALSSDPFSISIVELRHGIPIRAVLQFAVYRRAFLQLTGTDRERLVVIRQGLEPDGEYLEGSREEREI